MFGKVFTEVKRRLASLQSRAIHDAFKLAFIILEVSDVLKISRHGYAKLCITIIGK
jgi:hypothetical protein